MDEIRELTRKLNKKEKNAILFDRVSGFSSKDIIERLSSYPSHILDDYILSVEPNTMVKLIGTLRDKGRTGHVSPLKDTSFRVFVPDDSETDIEQRSGQNKMIEDVSYAMNNGSALVCEAPPGTGKSLAYLLPAVDAAQSDERTVISTNTKNLQMQIFNKDAQIACNMRKRSFSACMIKGIGNYLCLYKYNENKNSIDPLMKLALEGFIHVYNSGDLSQLKYFYNTDINDITSDSEFCMDRDCPYYSKCYFMKLRETAKTSDIIFTNHYLCLIDASMENRFFGEYSINVFDEAHNLENVISELFAYQYSSKYVMRMLYYFQKRTMSAIRGMKGEKMREMHSVFESILHIINELIEQNEMFFIDIKDLLVFEQGKRKKYNQKLFENNTERIKYILTAYARLKKESREAMDIISETGSSKRNLFHLARYIHEKIQFFSDGFAVISDAGNEEYAFFYETRKDESVVFSGVPVETGESFAGLMIKGSDKPLIFTSATLSVGGNFNLFKSQIGLDISEKTYAEGIYETSFSWNEQMRLTCITGMGNPNSAEFIDKCAGFIESVTADNRKTLVLATSYEQIDALRKLLEHERYIFHKKGDNPELIISKHKSANMSVLIGTNRYWEGIDLPGELLERVIILKMPFSVPDDPVMERRCLKKQETGINPFMGYVLPLAVLKLKQGIGRLIRKRTDRGNVYILDERVIRMRYGKTVLKSLFVQPEIVNYNNIVKEHQ